MATYSLSGSGVQTLSANVTALHVDITTIPTNSGQGNANPANRYHIALLRFGDATGYFDAVPVVGGPQWLAVPSGTTRCGYACQGGAVISVSEVIGGTPPFGGGGSLSGLSDVALASVADAQVLTYQSSTSKWINATPAGGGAARPNKVLVNWTLASDLALTGITAATWTDIPGSSQSFTVDDSSSFCEVYARGNLRVGSGSAQIDIGARLVFDSSTNVWLCGQSNTSNGYDNVLAGAGPIVQTLSAASHTVKLQVYGSSSSPGYLCRPTSQANTEGLNLLVIQRHNA